MSSDLYNTLRPDSIEYCLNTSPAFKFIKNAIKNNNIPHALLFYGPPGTGKTTLARIIANIIETKIKEQSNMLCDYIEVNCGAEGGKEKALELIEIMNSPSDTLLGRRITIFCIDEAQKLTDSAQNAFLKPVEDRQDSNYVIYCCSNIKKMDKALLSRCTPFEFTNLSIEDARLLVSSSANKLSIKISDKDIDRIISRGLAPREILVSLQAHMSGISLDVIESENEITVKDFIAVMNKYTKGLNKQNASDKVNPFMEESFNVIRRIGYESFRRIMLSYATKVITSNNEKLKRIVYIKIAERLLPPLTDVPESDIAIRLYYLAADLYLIVSKNNKTTEK